MTPAKPTTDNELNYHDTWMNSMFSMWLISVDDVYTLYTSKKWWKFTLHETK